MSHKQVVLFTCDKCGLKYQLVDNVEVVNKFAWAKWILEKFRKCIKCRG